MWCRWPTTTSGLRRLTRSGRCCRRWTARHPAMPAAGRTRKRPAAPRSGGCRHRRRLHCLHDNAARLGGLADVARRLLRPGGPVPGDAVVPAGDGGAGWRTLLELVRDDQDRVQLLIVSAHWGPNWGSEAPPGHQDLARALSGPEPTSCSGTRRTSSAASASTGTGRSSSAPGTSWMTTLWTRPNATTSPSSSCSKPGARPEPSAASDHHRRTSRPPGPRIGPRDCRTDAAAVRSVGHPGLLERLRRLPGDPDRPGGRALNLPRKHAGRRTITERTVAICGPA